MATANGIQNGRRGVQTWTVTEPFLNLRQPLGEGPHYHAETQTLRFVDIMKRELHTVHLPTGPSSHTVKPISHSVGITVDVSDALSPSHFDNKCIVAGKKGFAILDTETAELKWVKEVFTAEEKAGEGKGDKGEAEGGRGTRGERMRFNDGVVDAKGRFWAGSMNDFHVKDMKPEGAVYRLNTDLSVDRVIEGVEIPNGMGWSLDGKTFFLTDSPSRKLYAYPYDPSTGEPDLTQRRDFYTLPDEIPGVLDGCAMDVEGCIWSAVHEGSRMIRLSPEGELIAEIILPAYKPTCPVFVGTEMFIVTAGTEEVVEGRYDGAVFRVDVGVEGVEMGKFAGGEALRKAGF